MESLIVDALAVHRITKLVIDDEITEPIRQMVWKRFPPETTKIGYLTTCPWCVSIWAGAGALVAEAVAPTAWKHVARILAISTVTGYLFEKE